MNSVLVYRWGASNEDIFIHNLKKIITSVHEYSRAMSDYHADSEFSIECMQIIERNEIEAVFSFDYYPLLSLICSVRRIPYISWVYDCPMLTLESLTLTNDSNYIFCFDKLYALRLQAKGAKHCFHMPLAGNPDFTVRFLILKETIQLTFHLLEIYIMMIKIVLEKLTGVNMQMDI